MQRSRQQQTAMMNGWFLSPLLELSAMGSHERNRGFYSSKKRLRSLSQCPRCASLSSLQRYNSYGKQNLHPRVNDGETDFSPLRTESWIHGRYLDRWFDRLGTVKLAISASRDVVDGAHGMVRTFLSKRASSCLLKLFPARYPRSTVWLAPVCSRAIASTGLTTGANAQPLKRIRSSCGFLFPACMFLRAHKAGPGVGATLWLH